MSKVTRRDFVAAASAAAASVAWACARGVPTGVAPAKGVPNGATILLQGDSITDFGRGREGEQQPNTGDQLGRGYPFLLGAALLAAHPDRNLRIFNRGVGGNRVPDLAGRWEKDTIALKPDLVSILIGVNDYWHTRDGDVKESADDYERGYNALLDETKQKLPGVRLVVLEPFVLKTGTVDATWWPAFDERRAVAARVAARAGATYVTLQRELEAGAASSGGPAYWLMDGIHPTPAGHALIAERWRAAVGW
jgi:lysophospholipase L1-like esterase